MTAESYGPSEIERLTGEFFVLPDDVAGLICVQIDVQRELGSVAAEIHRLQMVHEKLLSNGIKIAGKTRDILAREVDASGFNKDDPDKGKRDAWCNEILRRAAAVSAKVCEAVYPDAAKDYDDSQFQQIPHLRSV